MLRQRSSVAANPSASAIPSTPAAARAARAARRPTFQHADAHEHHQVREQDHNDAQREHAFLAAGLARVDSGGGSAGDESAEHTQERRAGAGADQMRSAI